MEHWKELFSTGHTDSQGRPDVSPSQSAAIVSILSAGTFFGALTSPFLGDYIGRRWALIASSWVFNVGVALQTAATSIPLFLAGRFFAGFGVGLISALSTLRPGVIICAAVTAPKWIRGAIVGAYQFAITIGLLLAAVVNNATQARDDTGSYRIPIAVQFVFALILIGGMLVLPETPRYLVMQDKVEEAAKSLATLRRLPPDHTSIVEELSEIKANHDYERSMTKSTYLDCFRGPLAKRTWTGLGLQSLQQLTALTTDLPIRRAAAPEFDDFQPARTRGNAPDPQRRPPGPRQARRPQEQPQENSAEVAYDDNRVFVRLDENSPAWDKQPFAIRTHLADKLGIKLDAIPQASRTKTGWAIRPANLDIRNKIINEEACWAPALGATAVELATRWITYVIADCPRNLTDLMGKTVDYEAALKDEVEAQTGLRAISCRPSRNDDPTEPTKTLLISFLEQPKHSFRLFGTSRLARLIRKTARPNQCNLCWDYHSRHSCDRTARCVSCGRTPHEGMPCEYETQCLNCRGPHPSDDRKCPARPRRQNGVLKRLTQPEKRGVREIGERLFRQLHPEVAAAAAGSSPAPEAGARPSSPCEALTLRPTEGTPPPSPHKRRRQAPETPI
ncbi:high-affinity glucose transporter RGT2 [Ilyonectria robusta]